MATLSADFRLPLRSFDLRLALEVEGSKRNPDLVEKETCHERISRSERRRIRLKSTSAAPIATAASKLSENSL